MNPKNKTLIESISFAKKNKNQFILLVYFLMEVFTHISHLEELLRVSSKYNLKNLLYMLLRMAEC